MVTPTSAGDGASTRELIHDIAEEVRVLARDELELVRGEAGRVAKAAAVEGAAIMLGAIVTLIGFAMLCVAAVVALEPLIASLALRLVVMAIVFGVIGGVLATVFALRLRRDIVPDLKVPLHEAKSIVKGAKATLSDGGRQNHA